MTGRQEDDLKIEARVEEKLKSQPDYMRYFYKKMARSGKTGSSRTRSKYLDYVITFMDAVGKPYTEINFDDIVCYLDDLAVHKDGTQKSGSYMIAVHAALKKFFGYLEDSERITKNPMMKVDRPAPKPADQVKRVSITKDEVKVIQNNIQRFGGSFALRDELIFMLFMTTGMRCTALTEINVEDIDLNAMTIETIGKGNKHAVFYLSPKIVDMIKRYLEERERVLNGTKTGALFVTYKKCRIGQDQVRKMITKYSAVVGKHITPHKLRASVATILSEEGYSVYEIQQLLRHKSPQTTEIYLQNGAAAARRANEGANALFDA